MNGNALTSYSGESFIYNPNYANEYKKLVYTIIILWIVFRMNG